MPFTLKRERKSLCESCRNGQHLETLNGIVRTYCHALMGSPEMPRIAECSTYENRWQRAPYEMMQMAWTADLDVKERVVGFSAPKKERE